uniref:Secreted protein n=1 Tax=Heterorhabditis bacteriophora TaxID=37862 RepID=A0A1I7XFJ9_HETBA
MLQSLTILIVPVVTYAAVQCYVGQKLFSYESNNPKYNQLPGIPQYIQYKLIDENMSTNYHNVGREKCIWRDTESIAVLGPSIRTNPVLAPNHYIRDIRMERDGTARVDVSLEVCQYQTEREHCNVEKMNENEKRRFSLIQLKLEHNETVKPVVQKTGEKDKSTVDGKADNGASNCEILARSECGKEIQSQAKICCKDKASCDRICLTNIEKTLLNDLAKHNKGCSSQDVKVTLDCLGRRLNNHHF